MIDFHSLGDRTALYLEMRFEQNLKKVIGSAADLLLGFLFDGGDDIPHGVRQSRLRRIGRTYLIRIDPIVQLQGESRPWINCRP